MTSSEITALGDARDFTTKTRKYTNSSEDNLEELKDIILDLKDSKTQYFKGSSFKDILNNTKRQRTSSESTDYDSIPDTSSTIYEKTGSMLSKKEQMKVQQAQVLIQM